MAVPAPHMQASMRTLDMIVHNVTAAAEEEEEEDSEEGHSMVEGYGGSSWWGEGGLGGFNINEHYL